MEDRHADVSKKLRADLEAERSRNKQVIREKTAELRQLKQEAAHEKERALDIASKKLQAEKAAELKTLRDSLLRQKEQELRHVIKYKDEELKQIRDQLVKEKTSAMRHAAAEARKEAMDSIHDQLATDKARLLDEVWALREQKLKLEEEAKLRRDSERQVTETLRRKRQEWEVEKEQLLKQSRIEATRDYQQLRLAERVVQQKEQEVMQHQHHARILEVEKESLGEELTRFKEAESWERRSGRSKNDSMMNDGLAEGMASLTKRSSDDREKEVLQKVSRLAAHIRVLEERNTSLKSENSSLKQQGDKSDDNGRQSQQQDDKDKVRKLRQRNRELVALARRLEDEKKALKDGQDSSVSPASPTKELEVYKKTVSREKARAEAEHARQLATLKHLVETLTETLTNKEQEIQALTSRVQTATGSNEPSAVVSSADEVDQLRMEVESLEKVMKASAKEKLKFEKLVAENPTSEIRLQEVQSEFRALHEGHGLLVKQLEKKNEESSLLQKQIAEMKETEEEMQKQLQQLSNKNSSLAADLGACRAARVEMQQQITDMEQQLGHLDTVQNHCNELEERLHQAEKSLASTQQENQDLQAVAEDAKTKRQHAEEQELNMQVQLAAAHSEIGDRDAEILSLREMVETQSTHYVSNDVVENLQARIHELEQECVEKELQCISLQDKMEKLCEAAGIDFEASLTSSLKDSGSIHNPSVSIDQQQPNEDDGEEKQKDPMSQTSTDALISALEDSGSDSECISGQGSSVSDTILRRESIGEESISTEESQREPTTNETASKPKLENKLLPASLGSLKDELMAAGEEVESDYDSGTSSEDDDKNLMGRKNSDIIPSSNSSPGNEEVMPLELSGHGRDTSEVSLAQYHGDDRAEVNKQSFDDENVLELLNSEGETTNVPDLSLNEAFVESPASPTLSKQGSEVGSPMAVFVAKFDYNPETDSPNDNPNSELAITAGEYIYVYGDVDDDGFFLGEKEDGQKGMVPSNFVERVADDDTSGQATPEVVEDNEQDILAQRELLGYNLARELETVEEEDEEQLNGSMDSSKAWVGENESTDGSIEIPPPRGLRVEREFARSLLVSWEKPDGISPGKIQGYNVYVSGALKTQLKGSNKHRALLEGLDFYAGRFTVSVRTVTASGESSDPTNLLVLGKDPVQPPKDLQLKFAKDGSRSLHVTWMPVDPSQTPDSVPTGYKVYIDGVSAAYVTGAENSSAYISQFTISTLYTIEPHRLHVKTVSRDGESCESNSVTFTSDMLTGSSESGTEQADELRDSGVYSRGEQQPQAGREKNEVVASGVKPVTINDMQSEENGKEEEDVKDVDTIVESVKAEMSQQQQRQAEVVNVAAAQVAVTSGMFTIEGDNEDESETESNDASESDSEGEAVEIFASPDKSEASVSRDELSEGEVEIPVEEVDQNGTEVKLVDVSVLPSKIASIRKFTALFDYDPATMSPNEDGAEEELKFKKGDVITVYGDKDEDGFYLGEVDGRQGFVPYNMVTELVTETFNGYPESENGQTQDSLSPKRAVVYDSVVNEDLESPKREKMIALFDYNPHQHSPNADAEIELPLQAGDVIYVIGEVDEDGFYEGENGNGQRGLVPSNYLGLEKEEGGYQLISPLDGASDSTQDFDVHREVDGDKSLVSEHRKKKRGLLSKGKNLMKRLGKSGKVRQK